MKGDLELLRTLMERIPLTLTEQMLQEVKKAKEEALMKSMHAKVAPDWKLVICTDTLMRLESCSTTEVFVTYVKDGFPHDFNVCITNSNVGIRIRSIDKIDATCVSYSSHFPSFNDLWIPRQFWQDLKQGKTVVLKDFYTFFRTTHFFKTVDHYRKLCEERDTKPIYYIRREAYTCLAIHKFRSDSLIARLPKDVLKLILEKLWE